ncbi:MAG TPA: alpha-1,4-glucan--maltose-1-phosphate maltosyltransferase [Candidatus Binatia bacterium]|jgi:starch synthase (maltosyl-transferring)|nr:alpha-1,4-glucan--maltose-1-phosphate maltosyltransferase [Candidatus Binatia bacterium]
MTKRTEGRRRVVIEAVKPQIDGGLFPIKRIVDDKVMVEADVFADGHDSLFCMLKYRKEEDGEWIETPMQLVVNDRWRGEFTVHELGRYLYTVEAWVDRFKSWRGDFVKRVEAGQEVSVELKAGAELIKEASNRAQGGDARRLQEWAGALRKEGKNGSRSSSLVLDDEMARLIEKYPDRRFSTVYAKELIVVVDRKQARFSTWYEMFPRSCAVEPGKHATFRDCERRLDYIASMGFDVLYLPPVHPIGRSHRKGKNNVVGCGRDDPGSPWAIGSEQGGHKSIHPQLGTLDDFKRLIAKAAQYGIETALDIAFQCSPDHPYVKDHPGWFRWRPDGTIQYAENPPKKYQDIYPINFEIEDWPDLWQELKSVILFWIEQGIRMFRVDNPHTKPFVFWEKVIREVKKEYPDVIFLSEAFTRPKVMYRLAKLGFTQSYTYFTWRNTKAELTDYFTELTQTEVRDHFRPHLWPNTPDILAEYLQTGGRPAFMTRLVLAATLGANYGIYGPAYELCENRPIEAGSEEYLNSEKYEIKHWDLNSPHSLKEFIGRVNRIRKENSALHSDWSLRFHPVDNDQIICYSKRVEDPVNGILIVVNLDPHHVQAGWTDLSMDALGLGTHQPYQVRDLLTGAQYQWQGARNYVRLDPQAVPAHIFSVGYR